MWRRALIIVVLAITGVTYAGAQSVRGWWEQKMFITFPAGFTCPTKACAQVMLRASPARRWVLYAIDVGRGHYYPLTNSRSETFDDGRYISYAAKVRFAAEFFTATRHEQEGKEYWQVCMKKVPDCVFAWYVIPQEKPAPAWDRKNLEIHPQHVPRHDRANLP